MKTNKNLHTNITIATFADIIGKMDMIYIYANRPNREIPEFIDCWTPALIKECPYKDWRFMEYQKEQGIISNSYYITFDVPKYFDFDNIDSMIKRYGWADIDYDFDKCDLLDIDSTEYCQESSNFLTFQEKLAHIYQEEIMLDRRAANIIKKANHYFNQFHTFNELEYYLKRYRNNCPELNTWVRFDKESNQMFFKMGKLLVRAYPNATGEFYIGGYKIYMCAK